MTALSDIVKLAKKELTREGYLEPRIFLEGSKNSEIRPYPDLPEELKFELFEAVGYTIATENKLGDLLRIFTVSEAWVGKNIDVRPKDDPERYEAIFIFQYSLTVDTTYVAVYRTVRDKNDSLIELREGDIPNNEIGRALSPAIDAL